MKITLLEPQKNNRERLNLYLDGVFHCGLDIGTAARLGLYEGKIVKPAELNNLEIEDEYQKCMNSALNLASRRLQSEKEYWQKLGKKFDKPTIGKCLGRLRELGYADDKKFAEMWIRERSGSRGKRLLENELSKKGIKKDIYSTFLSEIVEDLDEVVNIAKKKYKPDDTYDKNYARITGLLTRKGYDYCTIKEVTNKVIKKATD